VEHAVDGPEPAKLVAVGIRVYFEGVRAVDGVDLILEQGQIMGLIGPNGAGKTTFMNAVSGFVPLTGGTVTVDGVDMTHAPPHRIVGSGIVRTFQDVATFPELSVFENVELGALGAGLNRRAARRRARELIDGLGLQHVARLPASALPHGDERRVGIARARRGSCCWTSRLPGWTMPRAAL
jgi:branched-chain amino acid transport system ATP-binding protein